ncbi:hypothetical protein F4821DRAFT_163925 [Hypoxylon rubiginosum]|uniref:Uncharacterized protein n=1 Tax=Hypoxylon rubiginosum TaxID=110542 RepID=A0ACC0CWT6_9PEZI|nr:hypothetical protein F4821DRAFT_163925 [Hypoxylon rubiginosum]
MRRIVFSFLALLHLYFCRLSFCAAIASATAVATTAAGSDGAQPSPTPTPPALRSLDARSRSDGLCGYWAGDAARPALCPSGMQCRHNDDYNVLGCVSVDASGSALGSVNTACLDYDEYLDYESSHSSTTGTRVGHCHGTNLPYCVANTYTGSAFEGYTLFWCSKITTGWTLLAWDATTSNTNTLATPTTEASPESPTSTTSTDSSEGLSRSDKIALGTALGIGLPATIAGIIAAWRSCF